MDRIKIKNLTLKQLEQQVVEWGEQPFRAQQIFKWLYDQRVTSFDEMTNLSKELRQMLTERAHIGCLKLVAKKESAKDGTIKFLFELEDNERIESVMMFEGGRVTLCISTQVGCAIDCKFCATGMMGLKRHLTSGEIVDQLLQAEVLSGKNVRNIVCMGMGEPFHNYDNLMDALATMTHELGPNLSARRIVVSTSGVLPKIYRFADEKRSYRLAISLNATDDETRTALMPLNHKWPISDLIKAAKYYTDEVKQPITFEYALMSGVNDTTDDASRLRSLVKGIPCKINLIPYNATRGEFKRPAYERVTAFYEKLKGLPLPVTIRWSKGDDIDAACGQLATLHK